MPYVVPGHTVSTAVLFLTNTSFDADLQSRTIVSNSKAGTCCAQQQQHTTALTHPRPLKAQSSIRSAKLIWQEAWYTATQGQAAAECSPFPLYRCQRLILSFWMVINAFYEYVCVFTLDA
jgi:hypothetical protein